MTDSLPTSSAGLLACYEDARRRTLALVDDLDDAQLRVPYLPVVNPFLWEIGHLAWFQEHFALRRIDARPSLRADADRLWDSARVAHATRWQLDLPDRGATLRYMADVLASVAETLLAREPDPRALALHHLCILHEDMHGEALVYMRQTLGLPPPRPAIPAGADPGPDPHSDPDAGSPAPEAPAGDVEVPGGTFELGARPGAVFAFDNERCAHAVHVAPFRLARRAVTQREFLAFVADRGYARAELWSADGQAWRARVAASHPFAWRRADGVWQRRHYDRWVDLEPDLPVCGVSFFEADAFCRWAGRRLPTEAEWELACAGGTHARKHAFPWGDAPPAAHQAALDLRRPWCAPAAACAPGDGALGVRQLIGNVWEWTADTFAPYPGFAAGEYAEYSAPWFGTHRVLRGGAFATRARLASSTYRNFFEPHRRDVLAGFRTAAPA